MTILCSCGHSETFRKSEDIKHIYQQGWVKLGFSIDKNEYIFICKNCAEKLDDKLKKLLNID